LISGTDRVLARYRPKTAFIEMCMAADVDIRPYDLTHRTDETCREESGAGCPHVPLPALRNAVDSIGSVGVVRPVTKETEAKPEHTLYHVAKMAEQLGIEGDKALQLLLEYERQQVLRKKARQP